MLQAKALEKIYRSKKGTATFALKGVSLDFPESGLVFLLGKSGSGKSTLLNLLGGIDTPTSGEIIIDGNSSKNFSDSDYDCYRNAFIGFVFQEYNLISEYSVGDNVSLALQLQGKAADKTAVDEALKAVDLVDENGKSFADRLTSELSGGQKQRVAIARALIKNPKIILADEPTGALDSTTGEQLFETLKNLSRSKLIIVVTHDRDFALTYGDRIIELKDGMVVSDKVKTDGSFRTLSDNNVSPEGARASALKQGETHAAEKSFVENQRGENVAANNGSAKNKDGFIKSKLPFKRSLKMGAAGLKHKPLRLISSILLSVIAFTIFGFSVAAGTADYVGAEIKTMYKNNQQMLVLSKSGYKKSGRQTYYETLKLSDEELAELTAFNDGKEPTKIIYFSQEIRNNFGSGIDVTFKYGDAYVNPYVKLGTQRIEYCAELSSDTGMADANLKKDARFENPELCRLPQSYDEIAITDIRADMFMRYGYRDEAGNEIEIKKPDDLIGLKLEEFKICGVFTTEQDKDFFKEYDMEVFDYDVYPYAENMRNGAKNSLLTYGFLRKGYSKEIENASSKSKVMVKLSGKYHKDRKILRKFEYKAVDTDGIDMKIAPTLYTMFSGITGSAELYKDLLMIAAYIGIPLFSLFAALLMMNFLSVTIDLRKRELGILRALGARKNDVMTICLIESLLLATIYFIGSLISVGIVCIVLNAILHVNIFSISFLTFGGIVLLCFGVSALATIIPVRRIAKKKPMDIINNM